MVQFIHDLLNLLLSNGGKGPVFGEILANEPIRVFIESAFPSRVGMGKEEAHLEGFGDRCVMGEFSGVICSPAVQGECQRFQ